MQHANGKLMQQVAHFARQQDELSSTHQREAEGFRLKIQQQEAEVCCSDGESRRYLVGIDMHDFRFKNYASPSFRVKTSMLGNHRTMSYMPKCYF
jgi:hypothetical protein